MHIYIAGPMRSYKFFNFPAFDEAKKYLIQQGHTVVSPADIDRDNGFKFDHLPPDWDWNKIPPSVGTRKQIIYRDCQALSTCDAIFLLKGWEDSVGARAEAALARWHAMEIIEQEDAVDYYDSRNVMEISKEIEKACAGRMKKSRDEFFSTFPKDAPQVSDLHPPAATKDTNPKDAIGSIKPGIAAVPCAPLFETGAALAYGGRKYGRHNWRDRGVRASVYYDAVMRHLMAWWEGEDIDAIEHGGSGLSHIAHAIAGLMVYRDAELKGNVTDDRPIAYGSPSRWLEESTAETCKRYPNPVAPFTEKPL